MHITVIIPFRFGDDPSILHWTLEGFLQQVLQPDHTMDIQVGIDGADGPVRLPQIDSRVSVHAFERVGAAATRNKLVAQTTTKSDLLIFGNADARPDRDMVQQHATTMARLPARCLVLGSAPWERLAPTVLDGLIDSNPMIFSYCHMSAGGWYPFRAAYSLNLSVRRKDYLACGGFHDQIRPIFYEDLAFACRVLGPQRNGVYYHPAARVLHHHPMSFDQYLDREELLGIMAPVLAQSCPEAFAVVMGGKTVDEIAQRFRTKAESDNMVHRRLYEKLSRQLSDSAASLGPGRSSMLATLYHLHLPLKMAAFRAGFLRGLELLDDVNWQARKPQGLWRKTVGVE